MRFQVPQFIEVEDKIFGPLTFKQFVYLAGGVGLSLMAWFLIPFKIISLVIILAVVALVLSLAFFKVNNKPFIDVMQAAIYFSLNHKLYIWKKEERKAVKKEGVATSAEVYVPKLSSSKLKEISWALDVEDVTKSSVGAGSEVQKRGRFEI